MTDHKLTTDYKNWKLKKGNTFRTQLSYGYVDKYVHNM